jgi:hypothetical protein
LGISSPSFGGLRSSRLVYLELRSAITSYSGVQIFTNKSSISCSNIDWLSISFSLNSYKIA